ncbi:MAG: beta-glucosidase, partial [Clostridia bacterium]|nr:beta-glucosidase [Clostridia bacterium]
MKTSSKASTGRTLKKVFLNISLILFAIIFTGNVIAGENAGQINQVLGTVTSKTISTAPAGTEETYARYFDSRFSSIAELKAAGEAKVREVEGEGIVLLKNEGNVLPLAAGSKVSLVGVTVMDPVYGGTGSGAVDADGAPNYYDVLTGVGYDVVDKPLLDY